MRRFLSRCAVASVAVGFIFLLPAAFVSSAFAQQDGAAKEAFYLRFLGTKAGTEYCPYAPTEPRSIFGYAMLHVPPNTVIDFAQDAPDKMRHWEVAEEDIDNILFTHSHFDHYDGPTVLSFAHDRWDKLGRKTKAFASETVFAALSEASAEAGAEKYLILTQVSPGDRIALAEGVSATVLPSSHWTAPTPVTYLLDCHGTKVFYAVDAAAFRDEEFAALAGQHLDAVITDCTYLDAEVDPEKSGHMNYSMVRQQMQALSERGIATDQTPCYITHLITIDHEQGAAAAREYGLRMAYDGLRVRLQ